MADVTIAVADRGRVVVGDGDEQVTVQQGAAPVVVIVYTGPPGPPGSGGSATVYEHVQSSAAPIWTVNHNLGRWPSAVTIVTPGGVEVEADVSHVSVNQLTISFAAAFAGRARII